MPLAVNQTLDGNVIKKQIGDPGAYGTVYEVENSKYASPIVLKLFNKIGDVDAKNRFHQENEILKKLSPHIRIITPLSGIVTNGSDTYYLMEKADYSLHYYHSNNRKIDIDQIKNIMLGICEGLEQAHKNNITHRDLYWNNVLIVYSSGIHQVKLADFGLARDFSIQSFSTIPNNIWGCFLIQPPEYLFRISDKPSVQDYSAGDMYALGILLFYLFDWFPEAHTFRFQAEVLSLLRKNNIDILKSPIKERQQSYDEWIKTYSSGFFKDLEISDSDLGVMTRVNNLIKKLCNPDYTKRYTSIRDTMKDIESI